MSYCLAWHIFTSRIYISAFQRRFCVLGANQWMPKGRQFLSRSFQNSRNSMQRNEETVTKTCDLICQMYVICLLIFARKDILNNFIIVPLALFLCSSRTDKCAVPMTWGLSEDSPVSFFQLFCSLCSLYAF